MIFHKNCVTIGKKGAVILSTIFTVEDDASIRELIEYTLMSTGFDVRAFENGTDFFAAVGETLPDLVLLDIMLPDMDGVQILKKLRTDSKTAGVCVIMLTAKSERMDKIRGLDLGADDYITKPFDVLELISRIKAVLRRKPKEEDTQRYEYGGICLDNKSRSVVSDGREVQLTYKEYELLRLLLMSKGSVVTREKIISEIWGADFEGESRTLDVHIRTLRQKLGGDGRLIDTVRNVGYKVG